MSMLKLSLPKLDVWDDNKEEFKEIGGLDIELEHSLYTISGWESKWKKAFANKNGLTKEQFLDYIKNFMCVTPDVPQSAWLTLTQENMKTIADYMEDPMSASFINRGLGASTPGGRKDTVTSDLIYYYMAQFNIPFECEHWHLNRLMKLIDISAVKNSPSKKMGKKEQMAAATQQAQINAARRSKYNSKG